MKNLIRSNWDLPSIYTIYSKFACIAINKRTEIYTIYQHPIAQFSTFAL